MPLASCCPFLKGFLRYSFFGYCKDSVEDILCGFVYEHILENFLSGLIDILKRTGLLPKNGLVLVVNIVSHKTSLKFLFGLPAKKFKIESGSPVSRCIAPHGTQCVSQPHYLTCSRISFASSSDVFPVSWIIYRLWSFYKQSLIFLELGVQKYMIIKGMDSMRMAIFTQSQNTTLLTLRKVHLLPGINALWYL